MLLHELRSYSADRRVEVTIAHHWADRLEGAGCLRLKLVGRNGQGHRVRSDAFQSLKQPDAWLNSPEHRFNILDHGFQDIGIAVEVGSLNGTPTILVASEYGEQ
jgi:uncharacterized protein YkwD